MTETDTKKSGQTVRFMDQLLELTDLDEKAQGAVDQVENFINEKKSNLIFVWRKFPYASAVLAAGGFLAGLIAGPLF